MDQSQYLVGSAIDWSILCSTTVLQCCKLYSEYNVLRDFFAISQSHCQPQPTSTHWWSGATICCMVNSQQISSLNSGPRHYWVIEDNEISKFLRSDCPHAQLCQFHSAEHLSPEGTGSISVDIWDCIFDISHRGRLCKCCSRCCRV